MARVELERVEKVYPGGTRALADCSLAIADGELLVLVGPSGCGKSTVLRLIAGLEEPTAGTLRIGDRVVNALPPQDRNVAMVFQDYALYPHLSARRNLEFPLRMRRLPRAGIARQVARVAALLDIAPLLDRLPRQLSGGQRQRVAMGRALVREPAVFLLDEPLSNLDATLRVQVRAEIKDLQRRTGTTMVYVTHDQIEAMTLGDRVAVLDRGLLQQVATPAALYDHPVNAFVAGFIGDRSMNLFPAHLSAAGGGLVLALGNHAVPIVPRPGAHDRTAVTAGVRPEALRVTAGAPAPGAVPATVAHVENLGHETLVHVRVDGDGVRLVARVAGMPAFRVGETVNVALDPTRVYLFAADGASLDPTPGSAP